MLSSESSGQFNPRPMPPACSAFRKKGMPEANSAIIGCVAAGCASYKSRPKQPFHEASLTFAPAVSNTALNVLRPFFINFSSPRCRQVFFIPLFFLWGFCSSCVIPSSFPSSSITSIASTSHTSHSHSHAHTHLRAVVVNCIHADAAGRGVRALEKLLRFPALRVQEVLLAVLRDGTECAGACGSAFVIQRSLAALAAPFGIGTNSDHQQYGKPVEHKTMTLLMLMLLFLTMLMLMSTLTHSW